MEHAPANSVFASLANTNWVCASSNGALEAYFSPNGSLLTERLTSCSTGGVYTRVGELYSTEGYTTRYKIRDNSDDLNNGLEGELACELIGTKLTSTNELNEVYEFWPITKTIVCSVGEELTNGQLGISTGDKVIPVTPLLFKSTDNGFIAATDGIGYIQILDSASADRKAVKIIIGSVTIEEKLSLLAYENVLGLTPSEATAYLGSNYADLTDEYLEYVRQSTDNSIIQNVIYYYTPSSKDNTYVCLVLDDDAYDNVKNYLEDKYYWVATDASLGYDIDMYMDQESRSNATFTIFHIFESGQHTLYYYQLTVATPLTTLIGKDYDEIIATYGEPSYTNESSRLFSYYFDEESNGHKSELTFVYSKCLKKIERVSLSSYNDERVNQYTDDLSSLYYTGGSYVFDGVVYYFNDREEDPELYLSFSYFTNDGALYYFMYCETLWKEQGYINFNDALKLYASWGFGNSDPYRVLEKNTNNHQQLFRIQDAYVEGYPIVIDATNANYVMVKEQELGYEKNGDVRCLLTYDQYYEKYGGYSQAFLKSYHPELYGKMTNNTITFDQTLLIHQSGENEQWGLVSADPIVIDTTIVTPK